MKDPKWMPVIAHLDRLESVARRMASVDNRLDADDLLQETVADVVENAHLYEPHRGPWFVWARTRCWLARTRALRILNRQAPRGRQTIGARPGQQHRGGDGPVVEPALGVGQWGTIERVEALADIQAVYDASNEDQQDALLAAVQGLASSGVARRVTGDRVRRAAAPFRRDLAEAGR